MSNVFGFSTEASSGGDFLPIVKYDARAGRMFRVDRVDVGGTWSKEPVDITGNFRALVDFENIETGWISFAGAAPDFRLVPIGTAIPSRPAGTDEKGKPLYSNGVRFMLKLSKECGGDKPIREIAGTAKAFTGGVEEVYTAYLAGKGDNPGKLPVIALKGTVPVKSTGQGQTSTNYRPQFEIVSWAARGDLVFQPKAPDGAGQVPQTSAQPASAPSTGSTVVGAPATKQPEMADADSDFG
jgi:hypothetical protein